MPPIRSVSLFNNVKDLNIEGGTFNMQNAPVTNYRTRTTHYGPVYNRHVRHTTVRQRLAREDIDALGSVVYSGIVKSSG